MLAPHPDSDHLGPLSRPCSPWRRVNDLCQLSCVSAYTRWPVHGGEKKCFRPGEMRRVNDVVSYVSAYPLEYKIGPIIGPFSASSSAGALQTCF